MRGSLTATLVMLSAIAFAGDDAALEARLKALEQKARDYDRLDTRVKELEAQLAAKNSPAPPSTGGNVQAPLLPNMVAPGSDRVRLGGQIRMRSEYRDPADDRLPGTFGRGMVSHQEEDAHAIFLRTRLWVDASVTEQVRAFLQIQDSRKFGEEHDVQALGDLEGVDIHQGYVEYTGLFEAPLSVRAGRFELEYGDGRLVSPLDWSNVGRVWDGVKVVYAPQGWQFDAFGTLLWEGTPGAGFTTPDDDMYFNGVYASCRKVEKHEFDLYYFQRLSSAELFAADAGVAGELDDHTIGVRVKGKSGGFDYSGEADLQVGHRAGDDVWAWAVAVTGGYTFGCAWSPRIGVEYDFASGDDDPTDGEYNTFDPLFPFGHAWQGHIDVFAWRNGHDAVLKLSAKPHEKVTLYCDTHGFWLDETEDAWYGSAGTAIRRLVSGDAGDSLGAEVDLGLKYAWKPAADFWIGYSRFFAGDYVSDTGYDGDMDWFFITTTVRF